jgi:membrane protease YdiL (CAAX protease family)
MVFFLKYSVGLHYCLLGIGLVLMFAIRLSFGKSQLPLVLPEPRTHEEDHLWRRAKVLIYLMIGPIFIVEAIAALPAMIAYLAGFNIFFSAVWILFWDLAGTFLILFVALWVMTATGRQMVLERLRLPDRNFLLLALGSAFAVAFAIPVSIYLYDRIHWATFDLGRLSPPNFSDYFTIPHVTVVSLIAAAAIEEVIFRGFLQTKLIQRYGVLRGIFVTGVAWAAIHFRFDTYPHSDLWAFVHLILRVAMCLALSFVFGWLTLKSGSILPAMLAHAAMNFFVYTAVAFELLPGESQWAIEIALWAILAYVLFRYWPLQLEDSTLPGIGEGEAVPVA